MAKLSARGRTEVARVARERIIAPESGNSNPVIWRRTTLALMSDRNVLEKNDVRWADGMTHTYPWKVRSKVKPNTTREIFIGLAARDEFKVVR